MGQVELLEVWKTCMKPLKNTVVNCRTQEEADECMRLFESWGWMWARGEDATSFTNFYEYKKETCYRLEEKFGYADVEWYKKRGYKVISFQELKIYGKRTEV